MPQENNITKILKNGGVGVIATDTIYGLVGRALDKKAVARITQVKERPDKKSYIVLIGDKKDLGLFGIKPTKFQSDILDKIWPGPISVVIPCRKSGLDYLHRGTKSLAFRLPNKKVLAGILKKTGPLIAPSANPNGQPPARNLTEAKKYFGDRVDFYSFGRTSANPSSIINLENDTIKIIREGSGINKIKQLMRHGK